MAYRIFVTATNTDIGKSYTTVRLLRHYASQGYRVGAVKPIETGVTDTAPDGTLLLRTLHELNPECAALGLDDVVPVRFELAAAPYVASGGNPVDFNRIDKTLSAMESRCDILLIEGAGGLLVPVDREHMIIDLITRYRAKALLVGHCRLGCINDLLLNLEMLKSRSIPFQWVLNCRDGDHAFEEVSAPYFRERFPSFFILQKDLERLAADLLK